jgi:hypothetical protein
LSNQLIRDLMIAFGFPAKNAVAAEDLWRRGLLPRVYHYEIQRIADFPRNRINPLKEQYANDELLRELNYKLTTGEIA